MPTDGPKSDRKLRLCSLETGKPDAAHVGAAKAALGPGYRGQRVQLPGGARAAAIRKVNAAARALDLEPFEGSEAPSFLFAEQSHAGLLVALWLESEAAARLAVPGGEPPDALHVTLCYCGDVADLGELAVARAIAAVEREVRWRTPLVGKVGGYGRFIASESSDGKDVAIALPDVPGLTDLRQAVAHALMEAGCPPKGDHGYTPHVTLAYLDPDADDPEGSDPSGDLRFAAVTVMAGARRIDIPFSAPEAMPVSMAEPVRFGSVEDADPASDAARPLLFAAAQEWIAFLPKPGKYAHVLYGTLDLTPEKHARILANFKDGVYPQDPPIVIEHDSRAAGAIGWIEDMRLGEDGGLEVKPCWTDFGRSLLDDDVFRYASAEFFDSWQHPTTHTWHRDVACGLAVCKRPHFKTDVLRPLAASEEAALVMRVSDGAPALTTEVRMSDQDTKETTQATESPPLADNVKALTEEFLKQLSGANGIGDPIVQQFAERIALEMADKDATAKREADRAKTLSERNAYLQAENRVKTFTDEVRGLGPSSGIAYVGHIPDLVKFSCAVAGAFGDDSWELRFWREHNRALAEQIKAGDLTKQIGIGRGAEATQTAEDQLNVIAAHLATTTGKTHAQAFTEALANNPDLRAALARERRTGRS